MKYMHKRSFVLFAIMLLLAAVGGIGSAVAQPQQEKAVITTILSKVKVSPPMAEPGQAEVGRSSMVIVTTSGRFNIIEETEVISQTKKESSMEKLPVPCEARIVYQPLRRNDPNALKIEVRALLAGATAVWAKPQPQ